MATSPWTLTFFNENIDYNRLAREIAIANQVDQLKEKESERKGKERKETILSYNK